MVCKVEDCNDEYFSKGYCRKHYTRVRKYGDPDKVNKRGRKSSCDSCTVEECGRPLKAKGLCQKHYMRSRVGKK